MYIIRTASIIIIVLYLCFTVSNKTNMKSRKIVIDTDPGGDDALAVMLALFMHKAREIEILAITVTYGNTLLENAEKNILKILTIADEKVLVYAGAVKPLINSYTDECYFGNDGFGDFNFTQEITAKIDRSKHASVALVDLVKRYPGEITVITLGPLTNIATAIALEPNFLNFTEQHIMMGANIAKNSFEFNFMLDPESDWIVLNNTNKPSVILPLDTVYSHAISKEEYRNLFNNWNNSIANFLHQAEEKSLEKQDSWQPADGFTMAIALQPDIIMQSYETNLIPELVGNARGSAIINSDNEIHNAKIIQKFDKVAFQSLLSKYFS